ncbi:NADPH-dependent F420 reductase [Pseudoclavibacter helvolus]|uniref:NADPH-dependent F420 reductase n=1 Tax=Pseudoclavibacter helvolus TaxID=255205 RepID=UPI0008398328|nr:NAD(P)-binding domain-containing protein [Pseudoclavibacter helvolus]
MSNPNSDAPATALPTIGILGAGKVGTVLARLLIGSGYPVLIAGSGAPSKIDLIIDVLVPGATTGTSAEVAAEADVVILALPLGKALPLDGAPSIPRDALRGKLVIDAMNYWWEIDGMRDDLNDPFTASSELVQEALAESRVVKAFNHMGYHDLDEGPVPAGTAGRRGIGITGDDEAALAGAAKLVDAAGFDPVFVGTLHDSFLLQPGSELFGANFSADDVRATAERFPSTERGLELEAVRSSLRSTVPAGQPRA